MSVLNSIGILKRDLGDEFVINRSSNLPDWITEKVV